MGFDWKEVLGKIAPTAATLIGGPFAGLAVGMIGKAMGMEGSTVTQIQSALTNSQLTGDQILAIKQMEIDLQKHLEDNGISLEQISANDRDSARKREIAVKDKVPAILAGVVTLGFFGTLCLLVFHDLPKEGHDVLLVLIGSLGTAWTTIIAYYYGSSAGSKQKDNIMGNKL